MNSATRGMHGHAPGFSPARQGRRAQRGSVLIVTLWTVTLMTILITVIAGNVRLSARAAFHHQEDLAIWANTLAAVNQAEMELMLEKMPQPPQVVEDIDEIGRNPLYRYNGQTLVLHYSAPEGMTVRIYDHAGKINIREVSRPRLRALLEKKLGADADEQIDALIAAWSDWLDLNRTANINGAEEDYYLSLDPPRRPRDGRLETVAELLSIRGFAEVFADVDLEAAFTLYTDNELVNLNLATREAMELLPGLDDESIDLILAWRLEHEFTGNGDVAQLVPLEQMVELRPWLNNRKTSNFYTIMAYQKISEILPSGEDELRDEFSTEDLSTHAYAEIVRVNSYTDRPRVLRVNPYEPIPARTDVPPAEEE
ncbi:MAG: type II secretion system protein GspK [Pseudomonadales bacterium]|nr:type II secretion system protein GspK [Pseudomonadales bacterium]